jgi:natural product biosynthesis luciferase-like monooxygenase protein
VWTPERHFHEFGGLYPNPSVTAAAVAAITRRVGIRAGSVVLPLHHPLRVVEEWSVVDNISDGRVGISFASGWQPNDFVLKPDAYQDNKARMLDGIETVKKLWRGDALPFPGPLGKEVSIRTLPRPVQKELPSWITTAGNPGTYRIAGEKGLRVLTHLLGQSKEELAGKIGVYREAWKAAGHPGDGYVTLMLHTFVAEDEEWVREMVRAPLKTYLRSSVSLIRDFAATFPALRKRADGGDLDFRSLTGEEMDALLDYSVERYYETSGLFGSPAKCARLVNELALMGVNEIACLIDFGVETEAALSALKPLNALRSLFASSDERDVRQPAPMGELMLRHGVTHMQCTPSLARLLVADPATHARLRQLKALLVGGEAFPPRLASDLRAAAGDGVEIHNMYGPTETTVWSTSQRVSRNGNSVPIGTPFANTTAYIVDEYGQLVPDGDAGELWIGGAGVARGYHNRDELTAARFSADPFLDEPGARVYRTGDLARINTSGEIEFLGRADDQVKILGHRIELAEVEAALERVPGVEQCVVTAVGDSDNGRHLEAFIVGTAECPGDGGLRENLRLHLPEAMVPSRFVRVPRLPLNANGKIDRRALAPMEATPRQSPPGAPRATSAGAPASEIEGRIAAIWRDVLGVREIGMLDNFFDIGGHSLLAVRVHSRLKQEFRGDISITDLFRYSTVRALAAHIAGQGGESGAPSAAAAARDRGAMRRGAQQLRKRRPK